MGQVDPILAALTGRGSPFEIGERDGRREFVRAAPNLAALIEQARVHAQREAVVEADGGERSRAFTYGEIFAWRDRVAEALAIAPGERVALCMRNRVEWIVAFMAVIHAGGVAALMNSRGSPEELVAMIGEVSPALVITDAERAALIRDGGYAGRLLDALPPADGPPAPPREPHQAAADDPAVILFTSGTTGRVKGAVLSQRNIVTGLMSVQLTGAMVLENLVRAHGVPRDVLLANMPQPAALLVFPLFHISGLAAGFLSPFLAGGKIVIMRRWDARAALSLIASEHITQFSAVPTMLWDLLHTAELADADLSSLRNVASGGQALPVNLLEAVRAACPQAMMGTGYGLTECAGSIAQAVGEDFLRQPASAGRVMPLIDLRIEDAAGNPLPTGQAGEIVVRSAQVMLGYHGRPDATGEVLSADGWLRTGDVGLVDEEGYIFIVDRAKDMVISGGENIYCAEVERALGEMPGITECAAIGVPDERLGEVLVAVVRGDTDERAAIEWVGDRLARYKAPARVAFVNQSLPRNHVGKVDKIALRAAWPALAGEE